MPLLSPAIRQRLDAKLDRLDYLRPLDRGDAARLRKQLDMELIYNSNALEGNSLTLRETVLVLEEGKTIRGKPLKDHLEARDHQEALDYLHDIVSKKNFLIAEYLIRRLHALVTRETASKHAGMYRTGPVTIVGARHIPPNAVDIPAQMCEMLDWLKREYRSLHLVELVSLLHHKLLHIHPFVEGNRRTARLLMNVILLRSGYPLAIILKNDRKKYYRVLQQADQGKFTRLALFIAQAVERSLDLYLRAFDAEITHHLLTLAEASMGTPYSPKYLNLLARTGALSAHKRGRIWYTTKQAIEQYRAIRKRQREDGCY